MPNTWLGKYMYLVHKYRHHAKVKVKGAYMAAYLHESVHYNDCICDNSISKQESGYLIKNTQNFIGKVLQSFSKTQML